MTAINTNSPLYQLADARQGAVEGIHQQLTRLDQNVAEVARTESGDTFSPGSRDRAIVEQNEIVLAVRANARSLQASSQALGTIIDIKI